MNQHLGVKRAQRNFPTKHSTCALLFQCEYQPCQCRWKTHPIFKKPAPYTHTELLPALFASRIGNIALPEPPVLDKVSIEPAVARRLLLNELPSAPSPSRRWQT